MSQICNKRSTLASGECELLKCLSSLPRVILSSLIQQNLIL